MSTLRSPERRASALGSSSASPGTTAIITPLRSPRMTLVDGSLHTEESDGLRAVCHQHEIDQLDGIFWIRRLSRLKRERLISGSTRCRGIDLLFKVLIALVKITF